MSLSSLFQPLSPAAQAHLAALSLFPAPFFAEGAALLWEVPLEESGMAPAPIHARLGEFVEAGLLQVDEWFTGSDQPALYHIVPRLQELLRGQLSADDRGRLTFGYAAYANWLVSRVYKFSDNSATRERLAAPWMDTLVDQASQQPDAVRPWYCWRLAVVAGRLGRTADATALLHQAETAANTQGDGKVLARVWLERGHQHQAAGDAPAALDDYAQSLALRERLGDLQGKAITLSAMATLHVHRGAWEAAAAAFAGALAVARQLGEPGDVAFQLVKTGQVAAARGDSERARADYLEALAIFADAEMPEADQVRDLLLGQTLAAIDAEAGALTEAALSAIDGGTTAALLPHLYEAAAYFVADEDADSPYYELATFVRAVAALLTQQPVPAVAPVFAERLELLRQQLLSRSGR